MPEDARDPLEDLYLVGPATASHLIDAGISPTDLEERRVTHADLLAANVNAGVAARIRRTYSLAWSAAADAQDLDRRATQVRGLDHAEQEWVAASAGDWTETLDRDLPPPTDTGSEPVREPDREPVTVITGIGPARAARLAEAGITSVRALASADPETVASALDLAEQRVRTWHAAAAERQD